MSAARDRLTSGYYNANRKTEENPGGLGGYGHRTELFNMGVDVATVGAEAAAAAGQAEDAVEEAQAAAATAVNGAASAATSSTAMTIGPGAHTFTLDQLGKTFIVGQWINIAAEADPADVRMNGRITAFASETGVMTAWVDANLAFGAGEHDDWIISVSGPLGIGPQGEPRYAPRVTSAVNVTLVAADAWKVFDLTGDITLGFDAPEDLGAGWTARARNAGSGAITLAPTGTVDGLDEFKMYPRETRDFYCDGEALFSVVVTPFFLQLLTSATFIKPPGYGGFWRRGWSGGGSGAKAGAGRNGGGGGGGACDEGVIAADEVDDEEPIVIGDGGVGPSAQAHGAQGGSTTGLGLSLAGGLGGKQAAAGASAEGGQGADSAPWTIGARDSYGGWSGGGLDGGRPDVILTTAAARRSVFGGGAGCGVSNSNLPLTGDGGRSLHGGGGGGAVRAGANTSPPGDSDFGGDGGVASVAASGTDGARRGGGGGATCTGAKAGDGGPGEFHIRGL